MFDTQNQNCESSSVTSQNRSPSPQLISWSDSICHFLAAAAVNFVFLEMSQIRWQVLSCPPSQIMSVIFHRRTALERSGTAHHQQHWGRGGATFRQGPPWNARRFTPSIVRKLKTWILVPGLDNNAVRGPGGVKYRAAYIAINLHPPVSLVSMLAHSQLLSSLRWWATIRDLDRKVVNFSCQAVLYTAGFTSWSFSFSCMHCHSSALYSFAAHSEAAVTILQPIGHA